jgi:hypothetical protein
MKSRSRDICGVTFFSETLYQIDLARQTQIIFTSSAESKTMSIVAGLALIMVLKNIIKKHVALKRMIEAVINVAQIRRIAMAGFSAL